MFKKLVLQSLVPGIRSSTFEQWLVILKSADNAQLLYTFFPSIPATFLRRSRSWVWGGVPLNFLNSYCVFKFLKFVRTYRVPPVCVCACALKILTDWNQRRGRQHAENIRRLEQRWWSGGNEESSGRGRWRERRKTPPPPPRPPRAATGSAFPPLGAAYPGGRAPHD